MAMQARMLPDGRRLHLNHGPIDLVIEAHGAPGAVREAYTAVTLRFATVLDELVAELPLLRTEIPQQGLPLTGAIARSMGDAVQPHWRSRVTPMAAVAGAVADHMLAEMCAAAPLSRAYVNNGGDIALHLAEGETFTIASAAGPIRISSADGVRGIATSGWRGRSFSLGIADCVTTLARSAATADVAATLIANAVDLPGSSKVRRQPANEIAPDSDLGDRLVTVGVEILEPEDVHRALMAGSLKARALLQRGAILGATLQLQNHCISCPSPTGDRGEKETCLTFTSESSSPQWKTSSMNAARWPTSPASVAGVLPSSAIPLPENMLRTSSPSWMI